MKTLDRVLGWLLILGGCGHIIGSLSFYKFQTQLLFWSLCASLFIFLLGAINLVRTERPGDRPLGIICVVFNLSWFVACLQLGYITGNMKDPRVSFFSLVTVGLTALSIRTMSLSRRTL
jgi:hypothetical protein